MRHLITIVIIVSSLGLIFSKNIEEAPLTLEQELLSIESPEWLEQKIMFHKNRCALMLDIKGDPIEQQVKDQYSAYLLSFDGVEVYQADQGLIYALKEVHETQQYGLFKSNYTRYWLYDEQGKLIRFTASIHTSPLAIERLFNDFATLEDELKLHEQHVGDYTGFEFKGVLDV